MPSQSATIAPAIQPISASGPPSAAMTSGIVTNGPMPIIVMTLIETAPRRSIARFIRTCASRCEARPLRATKGESRMHERSALVALARLGRQRSSVDFVESEALARQSAWRSGDAAGRRLPAAGIRSRGFAPLSRAIRPARLYRRRCRAGLVAAVGDQRRAMGRPADRTRNACRRSCSSSSTALRGWAARSTSTRSTTARYATYTVRDVVGHVDRNYRTIASEGGRAVLGQIVGRIRRDASRHGASGHLCRVCLA